jgi:Nucleoside 2-deoxyribosyltransferase like
MAQVLKPPAPLDLDPGWPSVFLAGSIEMGQAENWQARFEEGLRAADITILNPRRDAWDATWVQRIDHPQFRAQVEWELAAQERATLIAIYFAPAAKSPVTLLELGLFARSGKVAVCCPDDYWRKGNVEIVCARYGVPMVDSLDALIAYILKAIAS